MGPITSEFEAEALADYKFTVTPNQTNKSSAKELLKGSRELDEEELQALL